MCVSMVTGAIGFWTPRVTLSPSQRPTRNPWSRTWSSRWRVTGCEPSASPTRISCTVRLPSHWSKANVKAKIYFGHCRHSIFISHSMTCVPIWKQHYFPVRFQLCKRIVRVRLHRSKATFQTNSHGINAMTFKILSTSKRILASRYDA